MINKLEIFNHNINIIGNLSKLCRLCLSESDEMKLLYEEESCLPEMIMSIASVQVKSFKIRIIKNKVWYIFVDKP